MFKETRNRIEQLENELIDLKQECRQHHVGDLEMSSIRREQLKKCIHYGHEMALDHYAEVSRMGHENKVPYGLFKCAVCGYTEKRYLTVKERICIRILGVREGSYDF
jgi:hypothetical protein